MRVRAHNEGFNVKASARVNKATEATTDDHGEEEGRGFRGTTSNNKHNNKHKHTESNLVQVCIGEIVSTQDVAFHLSLRDTIYCVGKVSRTKMYLHVSTNARGGAVHVLEAVEGGVAHKGLAAVVAPCTRDPCRNTTTKTTTAQVSSQAAHVGGNFTTQV